MTCGGTIATHFLIVPTRTGAVGRHTKGTPSLTHPRDLDYTTKRGDKVFHQRGHYVRKKKKPFGKKRRGGDILTPGSQQALTDFAKKAGVQAAKDLLKGAAMIGLPMAGKAIYKKIRRK